MYAENPLCIALLVPNIEFGDDDAAVGCWLPIRNGLDAPNVGREPKPPNDDDV
jgi:hypothetical protein